LLARYECPVIRRLVSEIKPVGSIEKLLGLVIIPIQSVPKGIPELITDGTIQHQFDVTAFKTALGFWTNASLILPVCLPLGIKTGIKIHGYEWIACLFLCITSKA